MAISIDLSQFLTNADGSKNSNYPLGDKPPGQVELAWDLPNQYTNTDKLMPKTFVISYGETQGGPYINSVDMSSDTDPAMLRRVIGNLTAGTTYYFVLQTVDSEGYLSAQSSELPLTAALASTPSDPQSYTEIRQVDLPYTINTSGNYRIMENLSYDVDQASGITISADNVILFAAEADNVVYTVSTTGDVNGVEITGQRQNIEIYGFDITEGGHLTTSSVLHGLIYLSNAGNGVDGIDIHDVGLTIGQPNQNMTGNSAAYGAIVFAAPTGFGIQGDIRDCTFNIRGSKAGSGMRGVSTTAGGNSNLRVYNNTFNHSDASGSVTGYQRTCIDVDEFYGNTVNITDCDFSSGFGVTGCTGVNAYAHGNTFNVVRSTSVRGIIDDLAAESNAVRLYNDMNVTSTTGTDGTVRLYRTRFGVDNNVYGFSTISGDNSARALALMDIGGTQGAATTDNHYIYHNTASGMPYGLLHAQAEAFNVYLWGNTADDTNTYGMFLRAPSLTDKYVDGFFMDGDSLDGVTAGLRLNAISGQQACNNTHFANLGSLTIQNDNPLQTIQETHYFLDGDAGLITHDKKNAGTRTPNAPTNLRAA